MEPTTQEKILIEQRVTNEGPSIVLAYVLWFFLGAFSAHRFYLGRTGTAILQILLNCILVGFIWVVLDLFLIPGMVRAKQASLRARLTRDLGPSLRAASAALAPPARM
ncbi:TM2 domain-containing membrane protein YozV [Methylobacterium brachiatum]|jgi:TM2 domain-containing membrane protein YozV|uniref:TM2 domain-containing membrane protein YozV n=1 Tax=Methylobacterium brachiatum TaxID=269660 RepID=A0AAJ1WZD0_9HYPH|nr:TM2 domain-containing protein [Methylobacterium brachiatum]MCB4805047.1 TM2 domain-containing protein [Methylobacterium brachiatum]MDQ0546210.1 TM2 domain-containing membrane protein YozV [Methylobacterium brachiatum]